MSLLQILQQGIQAKERAQQADIDRGLRELQIGKEEKLQRDRFKFQAESDNIDRQHELIKLNREIAAERMQQLTEIASDRDMLKTEIDAGIESEIRKRRYEWADNFGNELLAQYDTREVVNNEIASKWLGQSPFLASSDESDKFLDSIKEAAKTAGVTDGDIWSQNLHNALISAQVKSTGGKQNPYNDIENIMSQLADAIELQSREEDTAVKKEGKRVIEAFKLLGYKTDENFLHQWNAYQTNRDGQRELLYERAEILSPKRDDETDKEWWMRRFQIQKDITMDTPTRENLELLAHDAELLRWKQNFGDDPKVNIVAKDYKHSLEIESNAETSFNKKMIKVKSKDNDLARDIVANIWIDMMNEGYFKNLPPNLQFKGKDSGRHGFVGTEPEHYYTKLRQDNYKNAWKDDLMRAFITHKDFEPRFNKYILEFQKWGQGEGKYFDKRIGALSPGRSTAATQYFQGDIKRPTKESQELVINSSIQALEWLKTLLSSQREYDAYEKAQGQRREEYDKIDFNKILNTTK